MSSEESETSTSSRIRQFGLYRTIDARTEDFLRLSKKRQIRQGCACAAVSTAITVTVVVVILLIYEYLIAVETSLVQRNKTIYRNINDSNLNITNDQPIADRLDRSYLGYDQDYFERMPLLVNALQENHYADPPTEPSISKRGRHLRINHKKNKYMSIDYRTTPIRRTSPRPFLFEYKSPVPTPFSKTYGSRNWFESYRNAQRLKNLQQVIKYLEKTINAKFGDLYAAPTTTHVAFSGVYVEPMSEDKNPKPSSPTIDLLLQSANKIEKIQSNHQSDPLFHFKPESPGDVNLLADGFLRFSPIPTPSLTKENVSYKVPMFRSISHNKRNCIGIECSGHSFQTSDAIKPSDSTQSEKPKSFSVMLNLTPFNPSEPGLLHNTQSAVSNIYFTTPRPIIQFKRKSNFPLRHTIGRYKRPRILTENKFSNINRDMKPNTNIHTDEAKERTKMIVHVNVYSKDNISKTKNNNSALDDYLTTTQPHNRGYATEFPKLSSTDVEDYHIGSSGIIPVGTRSNIDLPTIATMIPSFDSSSEVNIWSTNPPEILKFSHEDAKIPEEYRILRQLQDKEAPTEINRQTFSENIEVKTGDVEPVTIAVKLDHDLDTSTKQSIIETTTNENEETATLQTYVPQINGHYRSINQNSRNINDWLNITSINNRKKRLEMSIKGFKSPTYVPTYVEIKRNNTLNNNETDGIVIKKIK